MQDWTMTDEICEILIRVQRRNYGRSFSVVIPDVTQSLLWGKPKTINVIDCM